MLDYRHGSSGSKRSCRKKKGSTKMLLNVKGLHRRPHYQVNKKQLLSPFPSLSLTFFLITQMRHPSQRRAFSLSILRAKEHGHQEEQAVISLPGRVGSVPSHLAPFQFSRILLWDIYPLLCRLQDWPIYEQQLLCRYRKVAAVFFVLARHSSLEEPIHSSGCMQVYI